MVRGARRAVSVALLAVSLSGCGFIGTGGERYKPDGFPLRGYVSVDGAAAGIAGSACLAPPSAPDIVAGARVRAADVDGHVVASGSIGSGVLAATSGGSYECNFPFELANVSGARPRYLVLVGDRPPVAFDTRQLREGRPAVINLPSPGATASRSPS